MNTLLFQILQYKPDNGRMTIGMMMTTINKNKKLELETLY